MLIVRLVRLPAVRRLLLLEAGAELAAARLATALLPFPTLIRWSSPPARRTPQGSAEDMIWAVKAAAARMPFGMACLQQSVALQRMLRRRGWDARLHYGLTNLGLLQGHTWVTLNSAILIGEEEAKRFHEVAAWP